jgi:hypothetical protein
MGEPTAEWKVSPKSNRKSGRPGALTLEGRAATEKGITERDVASTGASGWIMARSTTYL